MILLKKHIVVIVALLIVLVTLLPSLPPSRAYVGQIKIGIIGPYGLPHWEPAGMWTAAQIARDEINAAGGIQLSDGAYELVLFEADEHAYPTPDPGAAAAEVEELITVHGVDFIIGGFRTECTVAMVEVAGAYGVPFIINGASTSEIIGNRTGTDHDAWKYLYRVNPVNSTMLFYTIAGAIGGYLLNPTIPGGGFLVNLFGDWWWTPGQTVPQVRTAVLMEGLKWTEEMYFYLTHPAVYPSILGPFVNVTYHDRIPDGTTDCTSYLQNVIDNNCSLLIHVFSGVTGTPLVTQWYDMQVPALMVGINVLSQLQDQWYLTGGKCEYESILNFVGTRTPINDKTTEFWDKFVTSPYNPDGKWPIYTAFGAYDAIYALVEAMEHLGTKDKDALHDYFCPRTNPSYQRLGLAGIFKYTKDHDVFSNEYGPVWTQGYVRAMYVQWLDARMEVVCPIDQEYSKVWCLPPWQYPLVWDITYDGYVGIDDVVGAAENFGAEPGHNRWDHRSDVTFDDYVGIDDIVAIAEKFGTEWQGP